MGRNTGIAIEVKPTVQAPVELDAVGEHIVDANFVNQLEPFIKGAESHVIEMPRLVTSRVRRCVVFIKILCGTCLGRRPGRVVVSDVTGKKTVGEGRALMFLSDKQETRSMDAKQPFVARAGGESSV